MRKISFILSLLLGLAVLPQLAEASHVMGVDITYTCDTANPCRYTINWRTYRDCSGSSSISVNTLAFNPQGSNCGAPTVVTAWQTSNTVTEVTPVCPGITTNCGNGTIRGVEEFFNTAVYDFCNTNCPFTISWSSCCRNYAITSGSGGNATYTGQTTIDPTITPCNSSPQFAFPPVPYICVDQPWTFNQGASDPDGDSLRFFLGPCYDSQFATISYNTGYSQNAPLGPNWTVVVDSVTGDVTLTPTPGSIEVGVLCIYVEEYRNGVKIGQVVRDMQITVQICSDSVPEISGASNVTGGALVPGTDNRLAVCTNTQLCFDVTSTDPDTGSAGLITMFWDQSIPGATFVQNPGTATDTMKAMNTVTGRFCWTPTVPGIYNFVVTAVDSACPIFTSDQKGFSIIVSGVAITPNVAVTGCGPATLCATPGSGIPPFTYSWTGTGGINTNPGRFDSCFVNIYNTPGVHTYCVTISDSVGCSSTVCDTLTIPNTVNANAGPDIQFCSGSTGNLGAPAQADQTYRWLSGAGLLPDSLSANPTVTLTNTSNSPISVDYILEVIDTITTCIDYDTVTVTVNPIPVAQYTGPSQMCTDELGTYTYTGPSSGSATFVWDFAVGNPATASTIGPHQVSWPTGGNKIVTLSVIEYGCTSAVYTDSVLIHNYPVANIQQPADQCIDNNIFNFVNAGTYDTVATHSWSFFSAATPANSFDENPQGIRFSTPGTKFATLNIAQYGCVGNTDTVSFNVWEMPDPNWGSLSGPQCFANNSYDFTASGNNGPTALYNWSFPGAVPATSNIQNPTGIVYQTPGLKLVTLTVVENGCTMSLTDTVEVFGDPVVDAGPPLTFCEGEGGVQLIGSGTAGTSPYYWSWWCDSTNTFCGLSFPHTPTPNANPTVSTTYYAQLTDFNGCPSNIDSVEVTVLPKPVVDAGPDIDLCTPNSPCEILQPNVTGAPGPFNYQWLPGTGLNDSTIANPCARPDTTTIYALVVSSSNGCTSEYNTTDTSSTVVVTVNPLPVAEAGPDIDMCEGDSIILQGFGFNAGPNYTYEWTPAVNITNGNDANPTVWPAQTTEYFLVTYSNGCPSFADTVVVNVHTTPTVEVTPANIDICLGETFILDGDAWGDSTATYTYNWWPSTDVIGNTDVEDLTVAPVSTTTYYVQATSSWMCPSPIDSATVHLKPSPLAEAGDAPIICPNTGGVELQGSYYYTTTDSASDPTQVYYTWTPVANLTDPNILKPQVDPTQTEWYYLTVNYNDCYHTDSVLVTLLPEIGATAKADTSTICSVDSVQLTATGGQGSASFTWIPPMGLSDPNISDPLASPDVTTTYSLVVKENGCADTVDVTINVIPTPEVAFLSSQTEGCVDFTVNFLETSANTIQYVWNFGDGSPTVNASNPTHTYTTPGTYLVTLEGTNAGGCKAITDGVLITVADTAAAAFSSNPPYPVQMAVPNSTVSFIDESDNATSYLWDFGDGNTSTDMFPDHTYTQPGEYFVTLTTVNEHGCVTETTHGPYIVGLPDLFIPNVFTPNGDGQNDIWTIDYSGDQWFEAEVYDRWGVLQYNSSNKTKGWNGMLNGTEAQEGVYFYTVKVGDRTFAGEISLLR